MNKLPKKGTKEYALADVLSRPNSLNGLYQKLRLPLGWENLKNKDAFYITKIADLADRIINEAIESGKDMDNAKVQDQLQAAFYGGMAGLSFAIIQNKILRFFRFRR